MLLIQFVTDKKCYCQLQEKIIFILVDIYTGMAATSNTECYHEDAYC